MPRPLATLEVLVVDGQSTGASPAHGHLLELGWARTRATSPDDALTVESRLLALPPDATIPRPITRLTGIRPDDLADAEPPSRAWAALCEARASDPTPCPVVIHYARFELPFLHTLHRDQTDTEPFPFEPLCTHEIARRLLPALPRRGLRALAGYLGLGVDDLKRSAEHVRATAFVWRHLVEQLEREPGVRTLPELRAWLEQPVPRRSKRRAYPMDRDKRLALPDAPGVYRMRRRDGSVLYVGKATSLRARVNGYFRQHRRVADRTLEMLTQARDLDVTVTATAFEAALLESDEIKAHAPPYNVMLRGEGPGPFYASSDLRRFGEHPKPAHRTGPLHSRPLVQAWAALADTEPGAPLPPALAELRWGTEALPEEVWTEGWSLFMQTWAPDAQRPGRAGLARIGARIWQAWREAEAEPTLDDTASSTDPSLDDADPAPDSTDPPDAPGWDPPRVAAFLERLAMQGAHELRRAAWLTRLASSTVAWPYRTGTTQRVLVLDAGRIVHRADLRADAGLPPPPGWAAPNPRPVPALDRVAFDRLRIVTAQLRRLVTEGRDPRLHCSPRAILSPSRLSRALFWV